MHPTDSSKIIIYHTCVHSFIHISSSIFHMSGSSSLSALVLDVRKSFEVVSKYERFDFTAGFFFNTRIFLGHLFCYITHDRRSEVSGLVHSCQRG